MKFPDIQLIQEIKMAEIQYNTDSKNNPKNKKELRRHWRSVVFTLLQQNGKI